MYGKSAIKTMKAGKNRQDKIIVFTRTLSITNFTVRGDNRKSRIPGTGGKQRGKRELSTRKTT